VIAAGTVERVADAVAAADPRLSDFDLQGRLRAEFDGLRVVVCSDDDVSPLVRPVHGNARCNLYFLDAGGHCARLSSEPDAAGGLVVALVADGDGDGDGDGD
jgi:hypothetical protein